MILCTPQYLHQISHDLEPAELAKLVPSDSGDDLAPRSAGRDPLTDPLSVANLSQGQAALDQDTVVQARGRPPSRKRCPRTASPTGAPSWWR